MLCDFHGNLHALGAVLQDVERADVDLVVFGGDVAAGPMPVETIEELARYSKPVRFIRGNADRFMVEIFDGTRESAEPMDTWSAGRLRRVHRDFLGSFEPSLEIELSPLGLVLCCHASPKSDELKRCHRLRQVSQSDDLSNPFAGSSSEAPLRRCRSLIHPRGADRASRPTPLSLLQPN